jgi:hypothetical protein
MRFRGHLIGGAVAGVVVVGIAAKSGIIATDDFTLSTLVELSTWQQSDISTAMTLFLLTLIMSLFPDLDTASVPQRWFFRLAFILLVVLFIFKQMELFAIVTFVLLLPLLHHHRGWTHHKLTPFAISIVIIAITIYLRFPFTRIDGFSIDQGVSLFQNYWIIILACVVGHYTHLLLDAR